MMTDNTRKKSINSYDVTLNINIFQIEKTIFNVTLTINFPLGIYPTLLDSLSI